MCNGNTLNIVSHNSMESYYLIYTILQSIIIS